MRCVRRASRQGFERAALALGEDPAGRALRERQEHPVQLRAGAPRDPGSGEMALARPLNQAARPSSVIEEFNSTLLNPG